METFAPVGEPHPTLVNPEGGAFFTLLDADGDERISKAEATQAMSRVGRLKNNPLAQGIFFAGMDKNHDGFLSASEFQELRQTLGRRRRR